MPLADQLERLTQMHASGALTDAEFAAAKAALLSEHSTNTPTAEWPAHHQAPPAWQLAKLQQQQAVLRVDQDWQIEREQYLSRGRVPTVIDGLVVSGIVVAMVVGLTIFAWQVIASVIGYILILLVIGIGVSCYQWFLVYQYSAAEAEYRDRRRKAEQNNRRY